ncbi:MAG: hypothetical protein ACXVFM_15960, partial [Solirubrobacteraceae bacterium]
IASPEISLTDWWAPYEPPRPYGVEVTPFDQERCFSSFLTNFSVLYNDRMASGAKEQTHHVKSGAVTH